MRIDDVENRRHPRPIDVGKEVFGTQLRDRGTARGRTGIASGTPGARGRCIYWPCPASGLARIRDRRGCTGGDAVARGAQYPAKVSLPPRFSRRAANRCRREATPGVEPALDLVQAFGLAHRSVPDGRDDAWIGRQRNPHEGGGQPPPLFAPGFVILDGWREPCLSSTTPSPAARFRWHKRRRAVRVRPSRR